MAQRDESIVPLSREHHYGLVLCLKIKRGLEKFGKNSDWLARAASHVVKFFEADLTQHFAAEEQILFPSIDGSEQWNVLVKDLLAEHVRVRGMVKEIESAEVELLPALLAEFAAFLERHIRKEENDLFPLYEKIAKGETSSVVGQAIRERVGEASRPRSPEVILTAWDQVL